MSAPVKDLWLRAGALRKPLATWDIWASSGAPENRDPKLGDLHKSLPASDTVTNGTKKAPRASGRCTTSSSDTKLPVWLMSFEVMF